MNELLGEISQPVRRIPPKVLATIRRTSLIKGKGVGVRAKLVHTVAHTLAAQIPIRATTFFDLASLKNRSPLRYFSAALQNICGRNVLC